MNMITFGHRDKASEYKQNLNTISYIIITQQCKLKHTFAEKNVGDSRAEMCSTLS